MQLELFGQECEEKKEPALSGLKVVVTGSFPGKTNTQIKTLLQSLGIKLFPSVTKNINYLLLGDAPTYKVMSDWEKLAHNGYEIPRLYSEHLDMLSAGNYEPFKNGAPVKKSLNFTMEHFRKNRVSFSDGRNVIASRELFCGRGFAGKFSLFDQIIGNLGASGDGIQIYPETNIIVLSDATLRKLENGVKDATIRYIEEYYNHSDAITFDNYSFVSESDILQYVSDRCSRIGDEVTMELYEKYMESKERPEETERFNRMWQANSHIKED